MWITDGHFLVAVTNGLSLNISSELVNCYRVLVKMKNEKLFINSMALPSFFISDGPSKEAEGNVISYNFVFVFNSCIQSVLDFKVTHLKWIGNSLLVGLRHVAGCMLEMWKLVEKATPIHRQFQTQSQAELFKNDVSIAKTFLNYMFS